MARNVEVKFVGNASSLTRAFGQASSGADSFSRRHPNLVRGMKLAGGAALGLAGVIGGGLAVAFKQGVTSLQEHEKANARTLSVIKSTGGAAKVTAGEIASYASRLEDVTAVDDVLIKQGENVLLTFTGIRNEVGAGNDIFRQATDLMVDFSVATGRDMTSAATLLGKALNDPIAGMTQLRRVGVQLTEAQKEQITAFVENGQVMEAQKVLLDALREKYEGAGEAAGNTLSGKIQKLKNKFEEFGEKLATKVMPYATRFVEFLTGIMESDGAGEVLSKIGGALGELGSKLIAAVRDADWGGLSRTVGDKVGAAIRAVDWKGVGATLASSLYQIFGGIGMSLFAPVYAAIYRFSADVIRAVADMVGGVATAMEWLAKLPGDFGVFKGLAEDARSAEAGIRGAAGELDAMAAWGEGKGLDLVNQALGKTGSEAKELQARLENAFKVGGIKAWASTLTAAKPKITAVDVVAGALAKTLGRWPTKKEITAVLNDKEFRTKFNAIAQDIQSKPWTKQAKVEALVEAAIKLLGNAKAAADKVPKKKETKVDAPGAKASKEAIDKHNTAAKNVPKSKSTSVSAPGAAATRTALQNVASAAASISRYITVTVNYVTSGRPPGAARGMRDWRGGLLMVGEQGPELVSLPRGADVYTNAETRRMVAGRGGGGAGGITWTGDLIVNGHVTGPDLAETVRRELLKVGRRNLTTGLV